MIVTIDGPAGAGKSSVARRVAETLGFDFLDTGAMYRAVTLAAINTELNFSDADALVRLAAEVQLDWDGERIFVDGVDVTDEIRTPAVTAVIRHVADIPEVRRQLSLQQRKIASGRNVVTEGRDQGSEVFPDADCKIFLTASPEQRALRRQRQLAESGQHLSVDEILEAQNKRDREDQGRPLGALRAADDATVIQSDGMTPEQVIERALEVVRMTASRLDVRLLE